MEMTSAKETPEIEQCSATGEPGPRPVHTSPASGLVGPPLGRWTKMHFGLLLVALTILVVAGQGQHFFYDEWAFVGGERDASPLLDRYLLPHNEHWSTLPLMAYRTLGATVGVGSYWPYLGLLLLLHLGVTHALWRLMLVTGSKPIVATTLATVFSVLGAAAEDLVWAFQIGFVGSTLLGVGGVYLAITGTTNWRKTGALAFLTLAGLATSGVGLSYLIAIPVVYSWRNRRHAVVVFCLPLLVYATWFALYGRSATSSLHVHASAIAVLVVAAFVVVGLVAALAKSFGFDDGLVPWLFVGVPILAVLLLACRDWLVDRTLAGRTLLAMCVGAAAFFVIAGLARGGAGPESATASRYDYVAIALLLPGIALILSHAADRQARLMTAIVPVAIVISATNTFQLLTYADNQRAHNDTSMRILVAASDLLRSNSSIFVEQLPEPLLAPDLTTADLAAGHLDGAFAGVRPSPLDRLTASLNLQIRVTSIRGTGMTASCQTTLEQPITVPTNRRTTQTFFLSADAPVELTLNDMGLHSTQRAVDLTKGTYRIDSLRDDGELMIESKSPLSLLANC